MAHRHPYNIPLDITLGFLCHASPLDIIIGARQACRALYTASKSRALWINLLRDVCKEENIFEPSYPIDTMSILDLEHAATKPSRFLSRLESRNAQQSLMAYLEQFVSFNGLDDKDDNDSKYGVTDSLRCLYAVPGGRFLVTAHVRRRSPESDERTRHLNIWDVDWLLVPESDDESTLLTPIATLKDRGAGHMSPVHPTRDGKGLLVFAREDDYVAWSSEEPRRQYFHIYEIYPTPILPPLEQGIMQNIRHVGKLALDVEGTEKCCLSFEHLAMVFNEKLVMVWNFVNGTAATWTAPVLNEGIVSVQTVMIKGNRIIVVRYSELLIWDIPGLYSCESGNAYDIQSIEPTWSCPMYPLLDPSTGLLFRFSVDRLDDWYMDLGGPLYFDTVIESAPDSDTEDMNIAAQGTLPTIYRYQLDIPDHLMDSNGHPVPADTVLTRIATYYHPVQPRFDDFVAKFYRPSQGEIVNGMIRDYKDLYIYNYKGNNAPTITYLTLPVVPRGLLDMMEENYAAVCPSSGRIFLYLARDLDEIVVLDTLRHPRWRSTFCQMWLRQLGPALEPVRYGFESEEEDEGEAEAYDDDEEMGEGEEDEDDEDEEMDDVDDAPN